MPGTYVNHNNPDDPLDAAMQPPEPAKFWGQVKDIEVYKIGFKRNTDGTWERPTPYNPDYHDFASDQIKFILVPLDQTRPIKELEMGLNNRKNPEFRQIVQPSIMKLGEKICQIRQANIDGANFFRLLIGLFIHGEYVKRPWNKDGEDWTTLEFHGVFATQAECQTHQNTMQSTNGNGPLPFPGEQAQVVDPLGGLSTVEKPAQSPPPQPTVQPQPDPMRASLVPFLQATWTQCGQNVVSFITAITESPVLSQHFTAASPEVQEILAQATVTNEAPF